MRSGRETHGSALKKRRKKSGRKWDHTSFSLGTHWRANQRFEREIAAARAIESTVRPREMPLTAPFQVTAAYEPAVEVGGDVYQTAACADGSTMLIVGDVSGKGLPEAMLERLSVVLLDQMDGGLATCSCLVLKPDGEVVAANAGRPSP